MIDDVKKVLVVDIDTIKAFMEVGNPLYRPSVETIKPNLNLITREAAKYGVRVLSLSDKHYGDSDHAQAEKELSMNGGQFELHATMGTEEKIPETLLSNIVNIPTDLCIPDEELKLIISRVDQINMEKQAICAFHDDNSNPGGNPILTRIIDILKPTDVFVVGVFTEYCVRDNAIPFIVMGDMRVWIVRDAISAYEKEDGDHALCDMANLGARFITTLEFIRMLNNNFGTVNG